MTANSFSQILENLKSEPEKIWLECDKATLNGSDIISEVIKAQAKITGEKVAQGDKVLVFAGRGIQFWIDVLALWGLGAVAIPVDASISDNELDHVIEKSNPLFYLRTEKLTTNKIKKICNNEASLAKTAICVDLTENCLASILFTSGSTGHPKGVMLSHSSITGNAKSTVASFEMNNVSKVFTPIPFRFVSSLSHFVATLYNKVSYCTTERKFLKTELLAEIATSKADGFGGSPLQLRWIAELAENYTINLKWLMASGDNLPKQTIERLNEALPKAKIVTAYGLTELAGRFCILPPSKLKEKIGSVGKPIEGLKYKILDDELNEVPNNVAGEIYVDGDFVFSGYINNQEKTATALKPQGFATGDIGMRDDDGFLYLKGRSNDVFKSAGLKVSTLPIAASLMSTLCFEDVAVIAAEDEILGFVPAVYYVAKKGVEFKKGDVLRTLRKALPPGHLPRQFTQIAEIPRTGSGKIKRAQLNELIRKLEK